MDFVLNLIFIIVFLGTLVISGKVLIDSNFEKCFKQGKVNSIKVAYVIVMIIVAFLVALAFKYLVNAVYGLIVQ